VCVWKRTDKIDSDLAEKSCIFCARQWLITVTRWYPFSWWNVVSDCIHYFVHRTALNWICLRHFVSFYQNGWGRAWIIHGAHATVGSRWVGVFTRFRSQGAAMPTRKKMSCTKTNSVKKILKRSGEWSQSWVLSWQLADIKTSWGCDENSLWLPGCCWMHGLFCHSKALVASNLNYVYCMYSHTLEASDEEADYLQDPSSDEVECQGPFDWNCWALHKWHGHWHCKGKIHKSVGVSTLQTSIPWQWLEVGACW
jgi:hypothetical protein